MRTITAIPLVALVGNTLAKVMIPSGGSGMHTRQAVDVTPEVVDVLDLYANYAASAPCNIKTPPREPVTCARNCDRVQEDGAIILQTYLGEKTEIGAYVAAIPSRRQIIFVGRGSSTPKNWETCFDFLLIPNDLAEGAMVHRGFQTAWDEIADGVLGTIEEALEEFPDFDIVFAGGSMGGAVATLGAANARAAGHEVDLYTFGSPRVGNDILSDFITNQPGAEYRVTHNEDPVPRLPPTTLFPAYRHISPEYWLTGEPADPDHWPVEDIKVCEGNASRECIARPGNGNNILDHTFYLGSLECWAEDAAGTFGVSDIPPEIQEEILKNAEAETNAVPV